MRAAEAFDDVLGDREPEPGARTPGGEVGIEDATEIITCNARALVADLDRDPAWALAAWCAAGSASAAPRASGLAGDRVAGVRQDVDERQPQPLGVGDDDRQRAVEFQADRDGRGVGTGGAGGILAERVEVGRRAGRT